MLTSEVRWLKSAIVKVSTRCHNFTVNYELMLKYKGFQGPHDLILNISLKKKI